MQFIGPWPPPRSDSQTPCRSSLIFIVGISFCTLTISFQIYHIPLFLFNTQMHFIFIKPTSLLPAPASLGFSPHTSPSRFHLRHKQMIGKWGERESDLSSPVSVAHIHVEAALSTAARASCQGSHSRKESLYPLNSYANCAYYYARIL